MHGRSRNEHDTRLKKMKSRLKKRKLKINHEKWNYTKHELNELGTIVSFNKLMPDPIANKPFLQDIYFNPETKVRREISP